MQIRQKLKGFGPVDADARFAVQCSAAVKAQSWDPVRSYLAIFGIERENAFRIVEFQAAIHSLPGPSNARLRDADAAWFP